MDRGRVGSPTLRCQTTGKKKRDDNEVGNPIELPFNLLEKISHSYKDRRKFLFWHDYVATFTGIVILSYATYSIQFQDYSKFIECSSIRVALTPSFRVQFPNHGMENVDILDIAIPI